MALGENAPLAVARPSNRPRKPDQRPAGCGSPVPGPKRAVLLPPTFRFKVDTDLVGAKAWITAVAGMAQTTRCPATVGLPSKYNVRGRERETPGSMEGGMTPPGSCPSPRLSSPLTSSVSSSETAMNTHAGIQNSTHLLRHVRQRASVLAFVSALFFSSDTSAQTSNLSVINASFLPINLEITDTLCDVVLFRGRITGNAKITLRSACLDRDRRVNLILTDLSRRQSYRFTGAPNTITLRRGSG